MDELSVRVFDVSAVVGGKKVDPCVVSEIGSAVTVLIVGTEVPVRF